MDFSIQVAKVLAKRSCKNCFGNGYQNVNWCGEKIPIINPHKVVKLKKINNKDVGKKYKNRTYYTTERVIIPLVGTKPLIQYRTWCTCCQKKVDKMTKSNEVKSGG